MVGLLLNLIVVLMNTAVRLAFLAGRLLGMATVLVWRHVAGSVARRRRGATGSRRAAGRNYVPRPLSSHRLPRR